MKHMILLISLLMTLGSTGAPWVPPIGIPEPGFGIKEQAPPVPAAWPGAASAGSYYIDSSHPNATDTANTYGYPDKPRKTIPVYSYVTAGSVTEIHGGPYLVPVSNYVIGFASSVTTPPTASAPAFIRGFSNVVIGISQEAIDGNANARIEIGHNHLTYAIIENIHFKNIPVVLAGTDTHHIAIRNCEISNQKSPALNCCPTGTGKMHDLVFYNNSIHDTLYWDDNVRDWDFHGINLNTYGRSPPAELYNVWVLDNTFYHCSGDSVQVNSGGAGHEALHHVYIGRNTAHSNRQSGFWCKEASDVIISQNVIYDMVRHGAQPGNAIGYQYGPDRLWIIFNEIYGCNFGIRQTDTGIGFDGHSSYLIGNYVHDAVQQDDEAHWGSPEGWGISLWRGGMKRYVVDNTIANVYGGIETIDSGPVYAKNNLIYNLKPNVYPAIFGAYRNHIECSTAGNGVDVDYTGCLLYGIAGGASQQARIKWLGSQYTTLLSAQQAIGKMANCIERDPMMEGVKLQANSPAIDKGAESDVYQKFQDLYGIDIRRGFDGGVRPLGAGWDIGACEYDHKRIAAPKGLRQEPLPK